MLRSSAHTYKSDEQLMADYKATGDMSCIEILFNRYCELVFGVGMKYLQSEEESKDMVVDIFEKVPHDLKKYDIKNFSHWIYIVSKNHCYQLLKKKAWKLPEEKLESVSFNEWNHGADEIVFPKELMEGRLKEALQSLNDVQQTCVRLFYLEQKSYEEIEQQTGFTYKQVKSYIQNGKRNMKIYLEKFLPRS